jgi:hypothetical protein
MKSRRRKFAGGNSFAGFKQDTVVLIIIHEKGQELKTIVGELRKITEYFRKMTQ